MVAIKVIMPSCGIKTDAEEQAVLSSVALLRSWGMQVDMPESIWHNDNIGAMDAMRQQSLLNTSRYDVLMGLRGGYGASRLWHTKAVEPWILEGQRLVGYSDMTSLFSYGTQYGAKVAHGPTLTSISREPSWSQARMRLWLEAKPLAPIQGLGLRSGVGYGKLWVANLTVLCHLLGTPHMPDLNQAVLICEDINEPIYKIDRLFSHLRLSGVLDKLSGLGLGRFDLVQNESWYHQIESLALSHVKHLDYPVVSRLPVGHGYLGNMVMPLNQAAMIDANKGLVILDAQDKSFKTKTNNSRHKKAVIHNATVD